MILSNTFPRLLAIVIPLSFEHFPLVPFLLYSLRIWPTCQLFGISSFTWIMLNASLKISLVFLFAFMNVSLGMSSGHRFFPFKFWYSCSYFLWGYLFRFFCCLFCCLECFFFTYFSMYFVHFSYSVVPGLAWYRFSKYSAMCSLVFSGSVMLVPPSVLVA